MRRRPPASPIVDVALIVAAVAVKILVPAAPVVEARYSNGAYPPIDRAMRAFSQPLPFALGDLLALALVAGALLWCVAMLRRWAGVATLGRIALRTLAVVSLLFVWFMVAWAYNYSRIPLADKIPVHLERTNAASVDALADHVVDELSANAQGAHAEGPANDATLGNLLLPTFTAAIARFGDRSTFAPYVAKPTLFDGFMRASGTSGFTDPWTHEVNLASSALYFERPAIYAHEWGHLSGFADESEANFISVLACTNSRSALLRYSGWILVFENLPRDVRIKHRLSRLARADLRAIYERYVRDVKPAVASASQAAYGSYLKANHVKAGYDSYRLFIRWMTAADFDASGLPLVRLP